MYPVFGPDKVADVLQYLHVREMFVVVGEQGSRHLEMKSVFKNLGKRGNLSCSSKVFLIMIRETHFFLRIQVVTLLVPRHQQAFDFFVK